MNTSPEFYTEIMRQYKEQHKNSYIDMKSMSLEVSKIKGRYLYDTYFKEFISNKNNWNNFIFSAILNFTKPLKPKPKKSVELKFKFKNAEYFKNYYADGSQDQFALNVVSLIEFSDNSLRFAVYFNVKDKNWRTLNYGRTLVMLPINKMPKGLNEFFNYKIDQLLNDKKYDYLESKLISMKKRINSTNE